MQPEQRQAWFLSLSPPLQDRVRELAWSLVLARPGQLAPPGDWHIWLVLAGRGYGKTKLGAEFVNAEVRAGRASRIALLERTPSDARDTMIEGDTGILRCAGNRWRPVYEPTKKRITWPNGAKALVFTAAEPDAVRGFNSDLVWEEELAAWKAPETHDNAMLGCRLGLARVLITTTPKPSKLLKRIMSEPGTVISRGRTLENARNLSPNFISRVVEPLLGTRLGRRELDAEMMEDSEGALWSRAELDEHRATSAPPLKRVVVALDPAVTSTNTSDEFGIVSGGLGLDGRGYLLADLSGVFTPDAWARKAIGEYHLRQADRIVAEANNGGDLIEFTLRTVERNVSFRKVHASRGKLTRAEPIAALYEQGRISHVGAFPELEDELCGWTPHVGMASPNRLDAYVWLFTELMLGTGVSPSDLYGPPRESVVQ